MWGRRWPGPKTRHSARPVESVRLDSEPGALVAAFARHRETPARPLQRQTEPTPLGIASPRCADDSLLMRLRNTTWDQPVWKRRSTWKDSTEAGATTQCRVCGRELLSETPNPRGARSSNDPTNFFDPKWASNSGTLTNRFSLGRK